MLARTDPLVIVVDTREQRPLPIDPAIPCVYEALGEGDYAARGFERYARIERKSFKDLWGTLHGEHDRFNAELSRLGDIPRVMLLIDDVWSIDEGCRFVQASDKDRFRLHAIFTSLVAKARLTPFFAGNRDRAAGYVVRRLAEVVEDFAPERLARCEEIARACAPYGTAGECRKAALASLSGLCVVCYRRPGVRPKAPGPGVCACGRKAPSRAA